MDGVIFPVLLGDEDAMRAITEDYRQDSAVSQCHGEQELQWEEVMYLDHAGASLASHSQLAEVFRTLAVAPLSNPHSMGPMGSRCEDIIAACREQVLRHFDADPSEYDVVFTSGSTAALKLVAESFPWSPLSALVYPFNAHTSVLGMREYAPSAYCVPSAVFHSSSNHHQHQHHQHHQPSTGSRGDSKDRQECEDEGEIFYSLLTVPGECNFSGTKMDRPLHELQRESHAQAQSGTLPRSTAHSYPVQGLCLAPCWPCAVDGAVAVKVSEERLKHQSEPTSHLPSERRAREVFLWMLDASKLASTSAISLSGQGVPPPRPGQSAPASEQEQLLSRPHFVCASFYKVFGYPTGLGALLVRRDVAPLLRKRYFGGGAVSGVVASADVVRRPAGVREAGHAHLLLEDGTLNYHGIAALPAGFAALQRAGGMVNIQRFTFELSQHIHAALCELRHASTGTPLCEMYGRHLERCSGAQGSVLTFNVRWADGSYVGFGEVGEKAAAAGIQLRVGCFCSIGGCQEALDLSAADVEENMQQGRTCQDSSLDLVRGRPTGAVRVSIGFMTRPQEAITRLLNFLRQNFQDRTCATYVPSVVPSESASADSTRELSPLPPVYLHSIYVYPIKSCAGFRVKAWPLGSAGLCLDREWVVISAITGIALTQKTHPLLSRCQPVIDLDRQVMTVTAPPSAAVAPLVISLADQQWQGQGGGKDSAPAGEWREIKVCYSQHVAQRCASSADAWFSAVLGTRCQLARRGSRTAESSAAPSTFSNSAQFLLLSMNSLRMLQQKMTSSSGCGSTGVGAAVVSVESFRPNFVVDRAPSPEDACSQSPHEEDSWRSVTLSLVRHDSLHLPVCATAPVTSTGSAAGAGEVTLLSTGPCARCSMVNIVPPGAGSGVLSPSGESEGGGSGGTSGRDVVAKNPLTLKTLSSYRKGQHGAGEGTHDVYFGQYFCLHHASQQRQIQQEHQPLTSRGFVHENMALCVATSFDDDRQV